MVLLFRILILFSIAQSLLAKGAIEVDWMKDTLGVICGRFMPIDPAGISRYLMEDDICWGLFVPFYLCLRCAVSNLSQQLTAPLNNAQVTPIW